MEPATTRSTAFWKGKAGSENAYETIFRCYGATRHKRSLPATPGNAPDAAA